MKEYTEKMGFLFRALSCSKSSFLTLQRSLLDSNKKLFDARRTLTNWNLTTAASTFRPRRSLLFVPADDLKKINKASNLAADSIILECEDGVAMNKKVRKYHIGLPSAS